ncbi:hypothetical protein NLJ89_g3774 [Agrocybe chaxingu]|uniref:ATP-dependent DNA helicase II subunit 1 n=1 Tax=Agrocybe chaxingu TaxID=84603 RepID=A0A9W8MWK1_9AGAR|nr:hypothetical protein NLJ89_g3774 [Agrocybe chaxingu]
MPPYDDWNKIDEEDDEELQDPSVYETKKDVILFCIDCSDSMLKPYDDPQYEDVQTCHLFTALEAAMQIQKKKIIVGPNDSVGILLFNTTRKSEASRSQGSEIKRNTFLFQPIGPLSAPKVQEIIQLLDAAREDPDELRKTFPPLTNSRVPMGDVFTSCNWVLRDGAPKTASKRVFLITDEDNPHPSTGSKQLITSARTTLIDLTQAGVTVEPFFISTEDKPFDVSKFYSSVLLPTNLEDEDELQQDSSILPESISISRIEDLLSQMRFHEVPKRALFSIPFELANGLKIGIKGYGLVTEQKKGSYKYFVDLGDRMEVATVKTTYVDEDRQAEVDKTKIVYGCDQGASGATEEDEDGEEAAGGAGTRLVKAGNRPFFTAEEIRSFRTLGLEPGIKLLGFKPRSELAFEDNIKHSQFIYPDEMSWNIINTPQLDLASDEMRDAARKWIDRMTVKNGTYPPDSYPNPALAYHNAQLEASAFREQYDPDSFEDLTEPKYESMHKRAGVFMKEWKDDLANDNSANLVVAATGSKRKSDVSVDEAEIKSKYDSDQLGKEFLKAKGQSVSGKKADLVQRVSEWFDAH